MGTEMNVCGNCRTITTCLELGCGQGRAAQPADVGAGELPKLPQPLRFAQWTGGEEFAYTADQMQQYALDAIAADRRARGAHHWSGDGSDNLAAMKDDAAIIIRADQLRALAVKVHEEGLSFGRLVRAGLATDNAILRAQQQANSFGEASPQAAHGVNIPDLRELLYRFKHHPAHAVDENDVIAWVAKRLQAQSAPVARVTNEPGYFDLESLIPDEKWPTGVTDLYAAPPLSSEPQAGPTIERRRDLAHAKLPLDAEVALEHAAIALDKAGNQEAHAQVIDVLAAHLPPLDGQSDTEGGAHD